MTKCVFILGSSHVGSTMLDMMLSRNEGVAGLGHFYLASSANRTPEHTKVIARDGWCSLCGIGCDYWPPIVGAVPMTWHEVAAKQFGVDVLVDASKKTWWISQCGHRGQTQMIHLVRNGLDRIHASFVRNGKLTEDAVRRWVKHERRTLKFLESKRHLRVHYEDICNSDGLQECCDYVGIDYTRSMRHFWEGEYHGLRGNPHTIALMQAHYGKSDMVEKTTSKQFVDKHMGGATAITHRDCYDDQDLLVFERAGGTKMNKLLGYT